MNEKMQLLEIIGGARARPAPIAATGLHIYRHFPKIHVQVDFEQDLLFNTLKTKQSKTLQAKHNIVLLVCTSKIWSSTAILCRLFT